MKTARELAQAAESYKRGERESFNTIYELSGGYIYTCIVYAVQDEEAAMDLMQDTYLEISTKLHQLENTDSFLQWATVIANRKCYAYLKKKKDILVEDDEDGVSYFDTITDDEKLIPDSILQDQEKQRIVRDIISSLSDMQRLCVIGYFYNEEKQEQIAEDLGIPVNTVKSHLNRAKKIIKEKVLELEKKEGTKLYGIAPFLLLFLAKEAEACEKLPMSQRLTESVNKSVQGKASAGRLAKLSTKAKWGIGIGSVAVVAAVGGIIMAGIDRPGSDGADESPIEETAQNISEENDGDSASDIASEESDNAEAANADASAQIDETESEPEREPEFTELDIAGEYDRFSTAWDGRVIVCKDDKWGLVTYEGEELIPIEYNDFLSRVNNDGQTVFKKDGVYCIFDRDGNLLSETEDPIRCVSDGVVLIVDQNQDTQEFDYQYRTLGGEVIYRPDWPGWIGQMGAVGFNEGFAFAEDDSGDIRLMADGSYTDMMSLRAAGALETETEQNDGSDSAWEANAASGNQGSMMAYPVGICHNGYYVSRGMKFEDVHGDYYVSDAEGKELYTFRMRDFYDYAGYDFFTSDVSWSVYNYSVNGCACYSYGTIINVSLKDGDKETYYLFDLAKLGWESTGAYTPPKMVITDEALLATGDYISLSDNKYWLYSKDGKYGYIDHEGNVIEMFDDAGNFADGRAVVIEDGQAYLIDEEFNRTETGIAADSVAAYGAMTVLWNGDEKTCLVFEQ